MSKTTVLNFKKSNERLLFLDIDGVVNTLMIYNKPIQGRRMIEKDNFFFELDSSSDKRVSNEFAIRWLNKLCLEYNLDIVITSLWLVGHTLEEIEECLRNSGLDERVKVISGAFHNQFKSRGTQIESWFINSRCDIDSSLFIILDDDCDMIGFKKDFTPYLVQCNTYNGFGLNEYSEACRKLDEQINAYNERYGYYD